jgi:hypothetical protein
MHGAARKAMQILELAGYSPRIVAIRIENGLGLQPSEGFAVATSAARLGERLGEDR